MCKMYSMGQWRGEKIGFALGTVLKSCANIGSTPSAVILFIHQQMLVKAHGMKGLKTTFFAKKTYTKVLNRKS